MGLKMFIEFNNQYFAITWLVVWAILVIALILFWPSIPKWLSYILLALEIILAPDFRLVKKTKKLDG
jgi:hypothetical protein